MAREGISAAASIGLTVAYNAAGIDLKGTTTDEAEAEALPNRAFLVLLEAEINTIAGGAATVTWFLAHDSAGDKPYTGAVTETILTGVTTATSGGFTSLLERTYKKPDSGTQGSLFLFAKTDAGTCNLIPRLVWESR